MTDLASTSRKYVTERSGLMLGGRTGLCNWAVAAAQNQAVRKTNLGCIRRPE
jgi:hypothetical protein